MYKKIWKTNRLIDRKKERGETETERHRQRQSEKKKKRKEKKRLGQIASLNQKSFTDFPMSQ